MILDGWKCLDDIFLIDGDKPDFIADIQAVDDPRMFRSDAENHYVVGGRCRLTLSNPF